MAPPDSTRAGEVLVEEGVLTQEDVVRGVAEAGLKGTVLGALLESSAHVRRADLAAFLAQSFRVPVLDDLRRVELTAQLAQWVPEDLARKHELVPIAKLGSILCIAKSNYYNRAALQDLRNAVDAKLKVVQADEDQVRAAIDKVYRNRAVEIPPPKGQKSTTVRRSVPAPTPAPVGAAADEGVPLIAPALEEVPRPAAHHGSADDIIEILDAVKIPTQEFTTASRDPLARLVVDFEDIFQSGRAVVAQRL